MRGPLSLPSCLLTLLTLERLGFSGVDAIILQCMSQYALVGSTTSKIDEQADFGEY